MNDQTPMNTAIAIPQGASLEILFKAENGLDKMLAELERRALADAETADVTTAKGRKHLVSVAYKVSQSKTELERNGKALTEKQRKEIATINAGKNVATKRLDELRDKIRQPVTDWEVAEEKRVEALKVAMEVFDLGRVDAHLQSGIIRSVAEEIEAISVGEEWEEYQPLAIKGKSDCLTKFNADLNSAELREANEAELAQLRKESAERAQKDEEALITAKAEQDERDRIETERLAKEQAERDLISAEKAEADRLAQFEREKLEAAESARVEAEKKAARDKIEAEERHQRELTEAKEREKFAAQEERNRQARIRQSEIDAREKREADQAHRSRILNDISQALMPIPREELAHALMDGRIPHVTVAL